MLTDEEKEFYEEVHKIVRFEYRNGLIAGLIVGVLIGAAVGFLIATGIPIG